LCAEKLDHLKLLIVAVVALILSQTRAFGGRRGGDVERFLAVERNNHISAVLQCLQWFGQIGALGRHGTTGGARQ